MPADSRADSPTETFAAALDLQKSGRRDEAERLYRALAASGGKFAADACINLGALLDESGRAEEALEKYREALALREGDPLALNNAGSTLFKLGRFHEAAEQFRHALERAPDSLEAQVALGAALQREGDLPAALAVFRDLVARRPDSAEAHWNLALALLLAGDFREGWAEYQWRWRRDSFTSPRRELAAPAWDGTPLEGRRILVHGEQGLGDTIQFARYLPMVAAAGGVVVAECQSSSLVPLLAGIPGVSETCVMGEAHPHFDLEAALLSLPHLFGTTLESVPSGVPYLAPPEERMAPWREKVAADLGFKVGLVWAGKPVPDPFRSCPLAALAPLFDIPGVSFYSLQVGEEATQAKEFPSLIDFTPSIADFGDTSALIAQLDLVVSIDTSVAHLAGALAKPVWLLLPKAGDYRWLTEREDSPWYPTMRLFRQKLQGEWGEVIERVKGELEEAAWGFLEKAALAQPFNGRRHCLCGLFLSYKKREREATVRYSKAAQLMPGSWEPHYALACSLQQLTRLAEAKESLLAALALEPRLSLLHEALGILCQMQDDPEGAARAYREALALDPDAVKARYNLATLCKEKGLAAQALEGFREVVRRAPEHADAHWNLAVMLLMTGEFAEGWREFPWRFKKSLFPPARRWEEQPRWDGSPLLGATILLYGEQGAGDTLQFVRYAPLVAERGGRVLVEVQSRGLIDVVATVDGVSGVFACGEPIPAFEWQASLMDLPGIFGTEAATIPAAVPYLGVDPGRSDSLRDLFAGEGLKVALAWRGNPAHGNDANRSIPLAKLAPLAEVPGVSFYSLQVGEAAREELPGPFPIVDLAPKIKDFADTAALAGELDLVICVDTSVAHLCGALGVPVWLLVPLVPDWRWGLARDDSPWYPTLRLFRQKQQGDWEEVVARVKEALARKASPASVSPQAFPAESRAQAEIWNNRGCAEDGEGCHLEAVESYRKAIALSPDFMPAHYNLGNSLFALGRSGEAAESYRWALALDPALPQGWHNLALALKAQGAVDEALHALRRAVRVAPDYLEARHTLGQLHHERGELDEAMASFRENLSRDPGYLPSWNAMGISLQVLGLLEEAVDCYQKALALKPDYLHALNNLGTASRSLGLLAQAKSCYEKVLELDPEYADARWNLALVQLQLGEYREGWQGYEWRFSKVDPIPKLEFARPLWDGGSLEGRTILLTSEQGFGDTFQFVRYAKLLAQGGATVLVQAQSEAIAPVIATVPGVARVLVRGEPLPEFDCHAPLMSLPHLCGTLLASIPAEIPYLFADPALVKKWSPLLTGERLRVGLVWAGRKSYKDDLKRSLSLPLFAPLSNVSGADFFALQVGDGAEQAASPPPGVTLTDLGRNIRNFADTAAVLTQLDLVITADTAVAHLAGGLGVPAWVLLPVGCDWRWLTEREDSPWYPGARLFRQTRRCDWNEVLQRVADCLATVVSKGRQRNRES
ncbi:TPR domain protein [Citrifermentans bemidjiense Bem]|uniref:TPR domain protein n=1 Tax=Citrifermentans bemidjiense (strain ATCC BAA-1014 / DSM 16622 / JCM 12645 / Bem) TaxID=404380 RepID=B5EDW2_CITBB|nr:tetratricopeptide repeat protein [Citrifermentans bemidjiense]ACH40740.1 TPR domain protein [Citrifermentans bemidjiense Bem]